jgi:hypothetical protein
VSALRAKVLSIQFVRVGFQKRKIKNPEGQIEGLAGESQPIANRKP